ncbi:ribonuclease H-like domain-containing protein, partial [Tanacetum coccineum]
MERISKKRTKNKAKTTRPDSEWKSVEKTKPNRSQKVNQVEVNPDKVKVKRNHSQIKVLQKSPSKRKRNEKLGPLWLMAFTEDHLAASYKGYDEFQSLLSQLEIHRAGVSTEDANQKFLRSLPSAWSQVFLIMRTKPGVDSLSFDDLYNNLRVFENDVKGSTASSSRDHSDYPRKCSICLCENHKAGILLESVEPREIKIRRRRDAWNTGKIRDGVRLVKAGLRQEVTSCLNECKESYAKLKKLYDAHREQLSDASIEIKAYTQGLKKVEAQLVAHQQGQLWFVTAGGMHVVPPPMTGNYMPSGPDIEVDYSQFTYGPKQTQPSESESQTSEFDTCESNISTEPSELVSEPVVNESNVECQPKVWSDAPIIEEYESDSEDEYVSIPTKQQETPSFANQQVKTPRETVKNQFTHSQKPKVDKKELGYGFTVRACFVCGSLNHLIRDCDFHEKRMARKAELNNGWNRKSSQREIRQTWNNVQRVNKQTNLFLQQQAVLTSTAIKVNTVKPVVNRVRPANLVLLREKGKLLLSPQQVVIGDHKDTTGTISPNTMVDPDYPHRALKNKGIVDSGCSRHMTGNKAYLAEFQDFNGGPVAFGGSKGYITGKGKIKTGKLDFEDVCFVKELQHFNLFSVSQMCDKKNKVLFTDSECLVLSPEFKLPDENQVLLKIPRQNNMYSFNLENIVPSGGLACLIAKATTDESNKWHRRLGHVNFKNLNKLVKEADHCGYFYYRSRICCCCKLLWASF